MTYTKPQILNVKQASVVIMGGGKHHINQDMQGSLVSSTAAYQSDE